MKFAVVGLLGIFLSVVAATPVYNGKDVGKVVKYQDVEIVLNPGQFSYVVHLEIRRISKVGNSKRTIVKTGTCAGAIIRPNVVLTAAHCIGDTKQRPAITAWAGVVDVKREKGIGQRIPVKYYKQHGKFVSGHFDEIYNSNDIAILWLKESFTYDGKYITQAVLPEGVLKTEGNRGWAVGWGVTEYGKLSAMLQRITLKTISQQDCDPYFSSTITDKVICAISDNKNSTVSRGDSGSPFIVHSKVVGLSSFGLLLPGINEKGEEVIFSNAKAPAVYTDVSKYMDWINNTLENGPPSPTIQDLVN